MLLVHLACSVDGKGATELTGVRPLLKPLNRRVQESHVPAFPDQIMRGASYVNEDLLGHGHEVG